jgi:hypothetical protein
MTTAGRMTTGPRGSGRAVLDGGALVNWLVGISFQTLYAQRRPAVDWRARCSQAEQHCYLALRAGRASRVGQVPGSEEGDQSSAGSVRTRPQWCWSGWIEMLVFGRNERDGLATACDADWRV